MNPIIIIGALGLGAIALVSASKPTTKTPKPTPTPETPPGGFPVPSTIDVSKILTQVFNDASDKLTPEQIERIKVVFQDLGTSGNGTLTTRPSIWAKEAALVLADELDKEGAPPGVGGTIRTVALGAMTLPEGPPSYENPNVSGPWSHLGSLTRRNRAYEASLGTYTDISGFGDWWESFIQKWASTWKRGPYQR
jgi:hypothetical protein